VGISGVFNEDYIALTKYIASMNEPSRFVWLPLNFASYSVIDDEKNPGHFYYGSSPLQFLSRSSDYTGFQSFVTTSDPDLNYQMIDFVNQKQYEKVARVLQRMNAKYVIHYHYDITKEYYDHMNFEGAIDQQKDGMFEMIAGEKIKDFGSRYSLYTVNEGYANDKLFLTETFDEFPKTFDKLSFTKVSPSQFDITIPDPPDSILLTFLEPFDSLWELRSVDKNGIEHIIPNLKHELVYRYGNGWTIQRDASTNTGMETLKLRLTFRAERYVDMASIVSIISWVAIGGFLIVTGGRMWLKHRKYENS